MTLSRFLRDYIYIPFGGNRLGEFKTCWNLFLTFLIGGLWHGAAWTFIVWGAMHGFALVIHRFWKKLKIEMNKHLAILITFLFINFTWVFFRAKDFSDATKVIKGMLGMTGFIKPEFYHCAIRFQNAVSGIDWNLYSYAVLIILLCLFIVRFIKNSNELAFEFNPSTAKGVFIAIIFCFLLFNINKVQEFLYFNF